MATNRGRKTGRKTAKSAPVDDDDDDDDAPTQRTASGSTIVQHNVNKTHHVATHLANGQIAVSQPVTVHDADAVDAFFSPVDTGESEPIASDDDDFDNA